MRSTDVDLTGVGVAGLDITVVEPPVTGPTGTIIASLSIQMLVTNPFVRSISVIAVKQVSSAPGPFFSILPAKVPFLSVARTTIRSSLLSTAQVLHADASFSDEPGMSFRSLADHMYFPSEFNFKTKAVVSTSWSNSTLTVLSFVSSKSSKLMTPLKTPVR